MEGFPEDLDRAALEQAQLDGLRALLAEILPANRFYACKLAEAGLAAGEIQSLEDIRRLPFTTKAELIADQEACPPYGGMLTYPLTRYSRMHQTSGTAGKPLRWLDTPESWQWLLGCWEKMFRIAGLRLGERLFFPFSFGPFLGFWTAFEGAWRLGYLSLPGGGMSSGARLRFLLDNEATMVLCTPTYALRLAEVAAQEGIDLASSPVRALIVAGEPGGSIPTTRARMETAWGARVFDHHGLTEVGALGMECEANPAGLHILETDYLAEVIEPQSGQGVKPGEVGELVLTNLGRWGSPLLRYRTGDLVRLDPRPCSCSRALVRLEGGILGRTDDMIHVRGNNFYPSALEAILRRFAEVAEYRVEVDRSGPLAALRIAVEPVTPERGLDLRERVGRAIRDELLFRAEVDVVSPGSLPRFEMKAQRVVWK
ncbi:MAG: phenylacetate--CoA ligase family protein [Planctomycetes bacterium]|nr:phenylacetate--CoA ligase family protein [Planctomycetota bacterium]